MIYLKKIKTIIILLIFCYSLTNAQSLKQKAANKLYANMAYSEAYMYFKELTAKKHTTSDDNIRKTAMCAYNIMDYINSEKYFKMLLNQFPNQFNINDAFTLFQSLKYNGKYNEVNSFLEIINAKKPNSILANSYKLNPNYLSEIKKDSGSYIIKNLDAINTECSEFSPYYDSHLNRLIFSSNRKNSISENEVFAWDNTYFIDSYSAYKQDSINFNSPSTISGTFKTKHHDGPIIVSADGKKMFVTRTNKLTEKNKIRRFDIIIYTLNPDGKWDDGVKFPFCSEDYSLGHPALTNDGKRIYFSSDMPGGFGKSDLWYSDNVNNQWQKPINLGPTINTEERESFPFIYENNILFFASDGRVGLGGLDIYFCSPTMDAYFEPQALSYPINTKYDDFGIYLNTDFKSGYIASNRDKGKGKDDIYYFNAKQSIINIYQKGIIYDSNTKLPISNAKVFLMDKIYNKLDSITTDTKGNYNFKLLQNMYKFKIGAKERQKFYDKIVIIDTFKIGKNKVDIYLYPKYRLLVNVVDSITNRPINEAKISLIHKDKETIVFEMTDLNGNIYELLKNKKMGDKVDVALKIEKEGYKTKIVPKNFILDTNIIVRYNFKLSKKKEITYDLEIVDENGNLINASIEVVNNNTNKSIYKNKSNGKERLQLKSGENYGISIAADGFLFQSENLIIPDDAEYNKVKRVVLKKLTKGNNIVLNNVFFDVAKSTLRPSSIRELDRLFDILTANPSMKIELSGHTDSHGNKNSNLKLSFARAESVVDYLISKGINNKKLLPKGYGFSIPVATNDTEEGRQLNRRTELKILEIN